MKTTPIIVQPRDDGNRPLQVVGPAELPGRIDGPPQAAVKGVPDLRGLGARDAMGAITRIGMKARIRGAGVVVDQQPAPGSTIEPGTTATLTLERRITVNTESSSSGGIQQ